MNKMGIVERKKRQRESLRHEILDASREILLAGDMRSFRCAA